MAERWKDIPGFEGCYQVSDMGRVRSLDRVLDCEHRFGGRAERHYKGRILSARAKDCGHVNVSLGANRTRLVHRLVLEAFVGPCPQGMECLHKDGNPGNNRLDNLHWGSRYENRADMRLHAQLYRRRQGATWLSEETIRNIKRDLASPNRPFQRELAEKYGVHVNTINNINRGFTHKWVDA